MNRLKEIEKLLGEYDHSDDPMEQAELAIKLLHGHVYWLINHVKELENQQSFFEKFYDKKFQRVMQERDRFKHALKMIAEHETNDLDNYVTRYLDFKYIARQVLKGESE